jgi:hypothetical protein
MLHAFLVSPMPRPSHPPWFYHRKIWWWIQSTNYIAYLILNSIIQILKGRR